MIELKALVFDITKYMIEDGPGIRTCIFFKGCYLRCKWCSNVMGLEPNQNLAFIERKCLKCGSCIVSCPNRAISISEQGAIITDYALCSNCGKCCEVCPAQARKLIGKEYTVNELINIVEQDRLFYRREEGGVTVSGGEILMQASFVREFLKRCKERLLSTTIETSGYGRWESLESILELTDFAFIDLKHVDPDIHYRLTGVKNELILNNIVNASRFCLTHPIRLIIRIPVIPGLNDIFENIEQTAKFIRNLPGIIPEVNLLPYHRYGVSKYLWLGKEYELKELEVPLSQDIQLIRQIFIDKGIVCTVGGSEVASY